MARPLRVEYADIIWPAMSVVGVAAVVLSALALMELDGSPLGGWSFYTLLIGIFIGIWGIWELVVHHKRIKRMREFLAMEGKSHLVRNIEEMEFLAWCLPSRWEEALKEKKRHYRVK